MSSGVARVKTGAFVATGALQEVKTVGFKPRTVRLINIDSADEGFWAEGMTEGTMLKRLAAGAGSIVAAPAGITPLAGGFSIGADADVNANGETVHYIAHE